MTNNDKSEDAKVINFPESPIKRDVKIHHPLSEVLRSKTFNRPPASFLNRQQDLVLTKKTSVQPLFTEIENEKMVYIPRDEPSLNVQKTTSCKNTILEDIAAINKLFGE